MCVLDNSRVYNFLSSDRITSSRWFRKSVLRQITLIKKDCLYRQPQKVGLEEKLGGRAVGIKLDVNDETS